MLHRLRVALKPKDLGFKLGGTECGGVEDAEGGTQERRIDRLISISLCDGISVDMFSLCKLSISRRQHIVVTGNPYIKRR